MEGSQTTGAAPLLLRGAQLGPYAVIEEVGRGGMGRVFRAHDERLDRDVALKLLDPRLVVDAGAQLRIRREAQALAQIDHPNVVRVFDVCIGANVPFIALEYVPGVTLRRWLAQRRRSLAEILRVFVDAARGLAAVHAAGLVHRDFKPTNVMIGADGRARVMDFGLARLSDRGDSVPSRPGAAFSLELTQTGTVIGTPSYMAPEQHRGDPADTRADQFAFGVALFEAVHREHPYAAAHHDSVQLAVAKHSGKFAVVSDEDVPRWLDAVLRRTLAAEPDRRYPSMEALVHALQHRGRTRGRRVALVAGTAGLVGASALFAPVESPPMPCAEASERLQDAWNDGRADDLRARWSSAPTALAHDIGPRVATALDGYADRWTQSWTVVCATDRESPPDAGLACLGDARRELHATADALTTELDARAIEHAMAWVLALPDPARCESADRSTQPIQAHAALRDALAQARVHTRARRFTDSERILAEVEAELAATPDEAVAALLSLRRAELASAQGDSQAARAGFEAAWHAAWAAGQDTTAAHAIISLVDLLGGTLALPVDALRLVPDAEAIVARVGDPNVEARLHRAVGRALNAKADYPAAIERFERALAIRERLAPVDANEIAILHDSLARALDRSGDTEGALAHIGLAVAVAEEALGPDHPLVTSSMGNHAALLATHGRRDQAQALLVSALGRIERALGPEHPNMAPLLNTLGIMARERGDSFEALGYHERVLAIGLATTGEHDINVARARDNLADDLADLQRFDEAFTHGAAALATVEDILGPAHPQVGSIHATLGVVELRRGHREAALEHFMAAIEIYRPVLGEHSSDVAGGWINAGAVLLELERFDEAVAAHERAIAAFGDADPATEPQIGLAHAGLARALVGLGEHARAVDVYARAIELYAVNGPDARMLAAMRTELAEARRRARR